MEWFIRKKMFTRNQHAKIDKIIILFEVLMGQMAFLMGYLFFTIMFNMLPLWKVLNCPILMLPFFHSLRREEVIMIRFCNLIYDGVCLLEPFSRDSIELRKCVPCILFNFSQFLSKQSFRNSKLVIHLQSKVFYKVLSFMEEELDKGLHDYAYLEFCFRILEVS